MSRSYQIRLPIEVLLSASSREKLGKYNMVFTLMDILPDERMKELLREKLSEKNCALTEDGLALPCANKGTAVFELENLTLHLEVPVPDGMNIRVEEESLAAMEKSINEAMASGDQLDNYTARMAQNAFGQSAAHDLKELAMEARQIINEALKETYRDAIKEKAGQFGSVSNITENSEGSTYRIRIEIES